MNKLASLLTLAVVALSLPDSPLAPVAPRPIVEPDKATTCHLATVDGCWSR